LSPNDRIVGDRAAEALAAAYFGAGNYGLGTRRDQKRPRTSNSSPPAHRGSGDGDGFTEAADALTILLQLQPNLSVAWVNENTAYPENMAQRLVAGLRKAGLPEK